MNENLSILIFHLSSLITETEFLDANFDSIPGLLYKYLIRLITNYDFSHWVEGKIKSKRVLVKNKLSK